jgi:RNA polymerase sigma factor (sigma-70 family)
MIKDELIPHLFRTEYSKITAVLCRLFGFEYIEIAEDIVSDTFLTASETWSINGLPEKPLAWLYTVAKNKAKNQLKHNDIFNLKISAELQTSTQSANEFDIDLSNQNITDSQLQMLFAVCHPAISAEAQISLALRILCGFGINEIADAFLINKETVTKRIYRAKETLREAKVKIEFPNQVELDNRLNVVLTTLYLLFNEGYYSQSHQGTLRKELCLEAMRLTYQLIANPATNLPEVNALLALMSFQASRFEARVDSDGELILYEDQDESLWNKELVAQGQYFLDRASAGNRFSRYHLEAGIACWHTIKEDSTQKWENVLMLYNQLLMLSYSPVAALNRTYALYKCKGKQAAIIEAEKLKLTGNHLYDALLGELYTSIDNEKAAQHFATALKNAKTAVDKQALQKKIAKL